jgi:hypothetical protein
MTKERDIHKDNTFPRHFSSYLLEYGIILSNVLPQSFEYRGLYAMQIVILWNSIFSHYGTIHVRYMYRTVRCDGYFGGVECPRYRVNNAIYVCIPYHILVFRLLFVYILHYIIVSSR